MQLFYFVSLVFNLVIFSNISLYNPGIKGSDKVIYENSEYYQFLISGLTFYTLSSEKAVLVKKNNEDKYNLIELNSVNEVWIESTNNINSQEYEGPISIIGSKNTSKFLVVKANSSNFIHIYTPTNDGYNFEEILIEGDGVDLTNIKFSDNGDKISYIKYEDENKKNLSFYVFIKENSTWSSNEISLNFEYQKI